MTAMPVVMLLTATALVGICLGVFYLRGVRKPVLIGVHFLLAAGGLETLAMLLHGTPDGTMAASGSLGTVAAGLVAAAMFCGLTAALLRRSPLPANVVLVTHASLGFAGLAVLLAWVDQSLTAASPQARSPKPV